LKLDPSAGRLAGRCAEATGTGCNAVGSHTAGRHEFIHVSTITFRTFRIRITGRKNKVLKAVAAGFTLVFVDRHGKLLLIFLYNNPDSIIVKNRKLK